MFASVTREGTNLTIKVGGPLAERFDAQMLEACLNTVLAGCAKADCVDSFLTAAAPMLGCGSGHDLAAANCTSSMKTVLKSTCGLKL